MPCTAALSSFICALISCSCSRMVTSASIELMNSCECVSARRMGETHGRRRGGHLVVGSADTVDLIGRRHAGTRSLALPLPSSARRVAPGMPRTCPASPCPESSAASSPPVLISPRDRSPRDPACSPPAGAADLQRGAKPLLFNECCEGTHVLHVSRRWRERRRLRGRRPRHAERPPCCGWVSLVYPCDESNELATILA